MNSFFHFNPVCERFDGHSTETEGDAYLDRTVSRAFILDKVSIAAGLVARVHTDA